MLATIVSDQLLLTPQHETESDYLASPAVAGVAIKKITVANRPMVGFCNSGSEPVLILELGKNST